MRTSDGSLLAQATKEHEKSFDMTEAAKTVPFRDSTFTAGDGTAPWLPRRDVAGHLQQIEDSGVAIYNMGGWFDGWTRDTLTMKATMSNPEQGAHRPLFHLQHLRTCP